MPPRIEPNYLSNEADCVSAVRLLRLIRRIAAQPSMQRVIVAEHRPALR